MLYLILHNMDKGAWLSERVPRNSANCVRVTQLSVLIDPVLFRNRIRVFAHRYGGLALRCGLTPNLSDLPVANFDLLLKDSQARV